mmetsp:Transcript_30671/g.99765  ORF Transcript_30671/g.99765 Transcript_30671/m.99765 type:complete len:327 (-) Transcript_30671:502-1482(-)
MRTAAAPRSVHGTHSRARRHARGGGAPALGAASEELIPSPAVPPTPAAPLAGARGSFKAELAELLDGGSGPMSGGGRAAASALGRGVAHEELAEVILKLEAINPTPAPALEALDGDWLVAYTASATPALVLAQALLHVPAAQVTLESLSLNISSHSTLCEATASFSVLGEHALELGIRSRLTAESQIRIREEYEQVTVKMPSLAGVDAPALTTELWVESLRGAAFLDEHLPALTPFSMTFAKTVGEVALPVLNFAADQGVRLPISGAFERIQLISYMDESIILARDAATGAPSILVKPPRPPQTTIPITFDEDTPGFNYYNTEVLQ